MLGKMLWFNLARDDGAILTDEDERLPVLGSAFAGGRRPAGRCRETRVVFEVYDESGERRAENVAFVEEDAPRRARRRSYAAR